MPQSFEELANEGIALDAMPPHGSHRPKPLKIITSLACILALGALGYNFVLKPDRQSAAEILLSVDGEVPGVLPHTIDSSTEFNESLETLKVGEVAPDYRETSEGKLSTLTVAGTDREPSEQPAIQEQPVSASIITLQSTAPTEQIKAPATALKLTSESDLELPRDWSGMVLVPDSAKLAKAYTSDVRLTRVEAHPIDGERIRVWARIHNLTDTPMQSEVGCEFRSSNSSQFGSAHFEPSIIPENGIIDVFFESPYDGVESYTVMVKRGE